jgi:hypothetical protein
MSERPSYSLELMGRQYRIRPNADGAYSITLDGDNVGWGRSAEAAASAAISQAVDLELCDVFETAELKSLDFWVEEVAEVTVRS